MFKVKHDDSKLIKTIFETLNEFVDDLEIRIEDDGLFLGGVAISRVVFIGVHIHKEDFEEYATDPNTESIWVKATDIKKLIKRLKPDEEIKIEYGEDIPNLTFKFKKPDVKRERNFKLKTFVDDGLVPIDFGFFHKEHFPKYKNFCVLSTFHVKDAVEDADLFSEVVNFDINDNLNMNAEGNIGESEYIMEPEEFIEYNFEEITKKLMFATSFMAKINKLGNLVDDFRLDLKSECPLRVSGYFQSKSSFEVLLAPRVPDDDDDNPESPYAE